MIDQAMMIAYQAIIKTRLVLLASFLFMGVWISGCAKAPEYETAKMSGRTMGTSYHITLVSAADTPLGVDASTVQQNVDQELQLINQLMSTYIADSELMVFNESEVGQWRELSAPLLEVLSLSRQISEATAGAFDITVGPLVNLWGFGPQMQPDIVPSDQDLAAAKALIGYHKLELRDGQARRTAPIFVDLSAVAKGYGVDWVAQTLEQLGIVHYMVEIGGEVRVKGHSPRGNNWRIAVEQPAILVRDAAKALSLSDHAVATSGDYRNYFEVDGVRYSHTIDPASGKPITHTLASVTVVADSAAKADAWATALNVLGPEKGLQVAEAEKLAVYMIVKDGDGFSEKQTTHFAQFTD
ncbi:FAD:protein FMN transferase [Gilvimarinus sp. SDUM040013]|uniref:FAD:protein FMN transferase n=1 Tax=Gilvimarinus gilvus TaxID=3058038 RepID=A0ABU4RXM1_9GAMM|nr:FAD:protein FMN transferase [Gilvimarinus sp. SDUM040013]MDO3386379.1 FAD:protein FMN transferase [Gilvimarinus sp. SDUM040013]MDX6849645.1 FAD:protein FMN transferase [Gilvimarinus sp. SDUM040013]